MAMAIAKAIAITTVTGSQQPLSIYLENNAVSTSRHRSSEVVPLAHIFVEQQIPYFICLARYFTFYSKILETYIEHQRDTLLL